MKINQMNNYSNTPGNADKLRNAGEGKSVLEQRSGLSVDDFLKIMAAEMQNQSPMGASEGGGGSKTDYMSQLAQFTSLEQMTDIVENLNYLNIMSQQQYSFSLIGKEVSLLVNKTDANGNVIRDDKGAIVREDIKGTVEKVKFKDGSPMISVNGKDYQLGSIMEVGGVKATDNTGTTETEGTGTDVLGGEK